MFRYGERLTRPLIRTGRFTMILKGYYFPVALRLAQDFPLVKLLGGRKHTQEFFVVFCFAKFIKYCRESLFFV